MHEQTIQAVVMGKWADYRPVLPAATVRFLDRERYLDVARHDASVIAELVAGWFDDFDTEFREPVLTDIDDQVVRPLELGYHPQHRDQIAQVGPQRRLQHEFPVG